jgi:UMF1 family MFS transporter
MSEPTPAAPIQHGPATPPEASALQKVSWVLYDWANSGYGLVVISAVFSPYFIKSLLPALPELGTDPNGDVRTGLRIGDTAYQASAIFAWLTSISMAMMAIGAPVLGAVADIKGWTRRLMTLFGVAGAAITMGMVFVTPGRWLLGAVLYVTSNFCFGTSFAFASAFLPRLTRPEKQGSLSGWGFAAGYVGGAVALILVLLMIKARPEDTATAVRWGLAMSGLWWLVFALPAYLFLDEMPPQATADDAGPLLLAGVRRLARTLRHIRAYGMLFLFLLAFLLYNDGVETVISMAGPFGIEQLGMTEEQLIVMLLIVQFVAFFGAAFFGYVADRIGNKTVIVINLIIWVLASTLAFFVRTPTQFMWLGGLVGAVLGGVQASSRALMALLSPEHIRNEAFGFFSISGKFASIFGPLLYGAFVAWFGQAKYGILSVLPFLVCGLALILFVREPRERAATREASAGGGRPEDFGAGQAGPAA